MDNRLRAESILGAFVKRAGGEYAIPLADLDGTGALSVVVEGERVVMRHFDDPEEARMDVATRRAAAEGCAI